MTYYQDKSLRLDLQHKSEGEWTTCFESGPIAVPSVSYLGFSAETGELSDNFDIISITTNNLYPTSEASGSAPKPLNQGTKSATLDSTAGSGWGWTFVKFLLFVGVCGGGYVGWTMWRASARRSSRFD